MATRPTEDPNRGHPAPPDEPSVDDPDRGPPAFPDEEPTDPTPEREPFPPARPAPGPERHG